MNTKQKLFLFLISNNPGIRDIYTLVKINDRSDFGSKVSDSINPLLNTELIEVSKYFDNNTPSEYQITEKGKMYLQENFNNIETVEYIKKLDNHEMLLHITEIYISRKNESIL